MSKKAIRKSSGAIPTLRFDANVASGEYTHAGVQLDKVDNGTVKANYNTKESIGFISMPIEKTDINGIINSNKSRNKNFMPLGVKQFDTKLPFECIRGSVWLAGEFGGLIGSLIYGKRWYMAYNDYKSEPFLEANKAKANKDKYSNCFWISLSVMAGSYGLNVLDNCCWTKTRKKQHCVVTPLITPQSSGFSLTYNF